MSIVRSGRIATISVKAEQEDATVYMFTLHTDPTEELTVCFPHGSGEKMPAINCSVLVTLHAQDSKWSKHAASFITDVPTRYTDNGSFIAKLGLGRSVTSGD